MKKLSYNIYSNILTDGEFIEIKKKLSTLESQMFDILSSMGWQITMPVRTSDGLAIDFTKCELNHYGNIGLKFDSEAKGKVFRFYVTKSYDVDKIRCFLADDIFRNKPFGFFENNINIYLKEALKKYDEWTDEKIVELGEEY